MSTRLAWSGRWAVAALSTLGWSLAAHALAPDVYLRDGRRLDVLAPLTSTARDDISVTLAPSESAVLATFTTVSPLPLQVDAAQAALWLVSGATPLTSCAQVTVELLRVTEQDASVVAAGMVITSLVRRRQTDNPVVVDIAVNDEATGAGERLGVAISVRNSCDATKTVTLLYDSLPQDSRVRFTESPIGPGATTTTTTTLASSTSTTLPTTSSCLARPLMGFAALACQLDVLDALLRSELVPANGKTFRARALRQSRRAQILVAAAQEGGRGAPRRLRRAVRVLSRLAARVRRGAEQGRLHAVAARDLQALVALVAGDVRRLEILLQ